MQTCSWVNNRALRRLQAATRSPIASASEVGGVCVAAKWTVASSSRLYGVSERGLKLGSVVAAGGDHGVSRPEMPE